MMRRGDKILAIIIILIIAVGYGWKLYNDSRYSNKEGIAVIEINKKVYGSYELKKVQDDVIKLELPDGEQSIVEFKDGKVRIQEADCPDKVCVRTGWISKPGEMIVCLPYRIIIKISGDKQDVDVKTF